MKQPRGDLGKFSTKMAGNLKYTLKHHWPVRIHTNLINQSHVEAKKGSLFQAREVDACDIKKMRPWGYFNRVGRNVYGNMCAKIS